MKVQYSKAEREQSYELSFQLQRIEAVLQGLFLAMGDIERVFLLAGRCLKKMWMEI